MSFAYVFVPADSSSQIIEYLGSKSGGLEKDELRLKAEQYFSEGGGGDPRGSSVEIVSLMLPCSQNEFVGVSMYCDALGKNKSLDINPRASSIANLCGQIGDVHGDVFFGRALDDESKEWERLDFTMADLSSDAAWVKAAQQLNKGKSLRGASTSGLLEQMMKQGNTAYVDGSKEEPSLPVSQEKEGDFLHWSQTEEEVEVKVFLSTTDGGPLKASDFNIKIRNKQLQILPKDRSSSCVVEPWHSQGDQLPSALRGEVVLWGQIDADSSGWTLDKAKDGKITLVITLAKAKAVNWPSLTV